MSGTGLAAEVGSSVPKVGPPLGEQFAQRSWGIPEETQAWAARSGKSSIFVNLYGSVDHGVHRLRYDSCGSVFDDDELNPESNISNPMNRIGEIRHPKTGKYLYTRRHIKNIRAVAFEGLPNRAALSSIKPAKDPKPWPTTYFIITWSIDCEVQGKEIRKHEPRRHDSWETRTTLRNRYGKKAADKII